MVLERATGKVTNLTENIDRWVNSFTWSPDSTQAVLHHRGSRPAAHPVSSRSPAAARADGRQRRQSARRHAVHARRQDDGLHAAERVAVRRRFIAAVFGGGAGVALTHLNDAVLERLPAHAARGFLGGGRGEGAGAELHGEAAGFRPNKKYPVLMLIHGGPQGAWGESWTYRWNAQVFAGAGYLVVMPNPRGSTGYGQKFIDEINGDWGGRAFDDIMAVTDHVATLPYADIGPHGGGGRVLRRLHGRLDSGPHAALQSARLARRRLRPAQRCSARPKSCGFRSGNSTARPGTTPRCTRAGRPATSRRSSARPRW